MSNFALDVNSSQGDIISSLNYALANLGTVKIDANVIIPIVANVLSNANVVTTNSTTGQVSSLTQGTVSYLYNYVNVKYANNNTGSIGFGSNSTGKSYYGVHNTSTGTISTNPADYNWYQVSGGFGTTKALFYTPSGGGTVFFAVGTAPPSSRYQPVLDDTPIYLQNLANSIVQTNNITPGAVTNVSIAANTIVANNIQPNTITALQIAAQTLTNAQIALSTITGNLIQQSTLTGNLIALNTITGNLVAQNTLTGNLIAQNTITGNLVAQNTITGNLIVPGTITGNLIQANTVITSTLASAGVTPGVNSGYGFWLTSNVGNAYFGGNITIGNNALIGNNLGVGDNAVVGNNLIIGNNAQIGGNLNVSGLITSANLNANTVATTTIIQNAVTTILSNTTTNQTIISSPSANIRYSYGGNITITANTGYQFLITALSSPALTFSTPPDSLSNWVFFLRVIMKYPDGTLTSVGEYQTFINWVTGYTVIGPIIPLSGQTLAATQNGTYNFWLQSSYYTPTPAQPAPTSLLDGGSSVVVNLLKR
jgi:carbonic anhydrase/acetyltransferase-like protein (isoleucine patch superfamily)